MKTYLYRFMLIFYVCYKMIRTEGLDFENFTALSLNKRFWTLKTSQH